jgi:GGDEF domain-containing protein
MRRTAWFVGAALLLSIAAVMAAAPPPAGSLSLSLHLAPVFVFGGGSVLAMIGRRSRLVAGLATIVLADRALLHLGRGVTFDVVSLLLPLNLAVLAWLPEAHPLTSTGAVRIGVIGLQAGAVWFLHSTEIALLPASFHLPIDEARLHAWSALPLATLGVLASALGVTALRILLHRHMPAAGIAWALIASFIALDAAMSGAPATVHFMTAALLLIVGMIGDPARTVYPDPVTGLPTRIELTRMLRRMPRRYAIACIQVDEFRRFRDSYGPDATRRMLRGVGRALGEAGGRAFAGDTGTFVIVFPRASATQASAHLETVREKIPGRMHEVLLREEVLFRPEAAWEPPTVALKRASVAVTISAGVAEPAWPDADPRDVLSAAEQALAVAKREGHRVVN